MLKPLKTKGYVAIMISMKDYALIWDNCAVQHKANFDYPPELRRRMQRCTIEGDVPF